MAPTRRCYGPDTVVIVDDTLIPTRDHAGEKPPVLSQPAGHARGRHPASRHRRLAPAGQPQRLHCPHQPENPPHRGQDDRAGRRQLPGQRPTDPAPSPGQPNPPARLNRPQHHPHRKVRAHTEHTSPTGRPRRPRVTAPATDPVSTRPPPAAPTPPPHPHRRTTRGDKTTLTTEGLRDNP